MARRTFPSGPRGLGLHRVEAPEARPHVLVEAREGAGQELLLVLHRRRGPVARLRTSMSRRFR